MAHIKVTDISHVRFAAPDLEKMKSFLEDFGLVTFMDNNGVLYGRGCGIAPFAHATTIGEPGFLALGFRANSVDDLEILAKAEGAVVEDFNAPGGGRVVRLVDPDGRLVEVVAGQALSAPQTLPLEPIRNSAHNAPRLRTSVRIQPGPATVMRLGHCVLEVSDFRVLEGWYKKRFGLITSDEIQMAPGVAIGAFMRCDRSEIPSDHHTLFLLQSPNAPRFNHAAFEVADFDNLMRGHTHLKNAGRKPTWGVGRHILGSQIFDYWLDPWGHELEHWTDGDLFAASDPAHVNSFQELLGVQWGPQHPMMIGQGS